MARNRRRNVGTAAFGAVLALALSASTAFATFPGANGRIAYDGPGGIHTIRPNGSGDRLLASGERPSWSADGSRIAYLGVVNHHEEIFTMRADGSDQRRVTHSQCCLDHPAYSPSGARIAFNRSPLSGPVTYTILDVRPDGSDHRVLAKGLSPTYSPDGRRIAYAGLGSRLAIWTMRANGSHERQLTHPDAQHSDVLPDYSPDGKHILFHRIGKRSEHVFVMRSDGSRVHRVGCGDVYSPNGRKLAWSGVTGYDDQGGGPFTEIFTSTRQCTDPFQVTHYGSTPYAASDPTWQPLPSTRNRAR